MLTPRDRLKIAVLQLCAERGLDLAQTEAVVKQAAARMTKEANPLAAIAGGLWNAGSGAVSGLWNSGLDVGKKLVTDVGIPAAGMGLGALAAAPLVGGAMVGRGLARYQGITDEDINEERQRELIGAYHDAAQRIAENRRRAQQPSAPTAGGRQLL